jgi:translation elongation factor EF-1beta
MPHLWVCDWEKQEMQTPGSPIYLSRVWLSGTLGGIVMGHVVVKYKVTMDQPEDGSPDYDGIASRIGELQEVQTFEIKPLAFGMMFIEVQAVLEDGEGTVDEFEARVRGTDPLVGQIETLEMGRL